MSWIIRTCPRCGAKKIKMTIVGSARTDKRWWEIQAQCEECRESALFDAPASSAAESQNLDPKAFSTSLDGNEYFSPSDTPIFLTGGEFVPAKEIPPRIADLLRQAAACRRINLFDASGAMFRKALDVATQHIFKTDQRVVKETPATALRVRIQQLGAKKVLDADMVELAETAALDGNDAAHDEDPYTGEEADALEDLTIDLLDRLFVRPARVAAVKAKQATALAAKQAKP